MADPNTQPSLRDRAMAILLELQAEEREVNTGEKQALALLDEKAKRARVALGIEDDGEEQS